MKTNIVIVVKGGNVQNVFAEGIGEYNVIMLDYDNFDAGQEKTVEEAEAEKMIEESNIFNCIY